MSNPTITVWLDVDTGHDDAFALLFAAHHPAATLLGVSTVYGNASLADTTNNTISVLTALFRTDVPVYIGAEKAFCRGLASAPDIHGVTGLDGTTCLPKPAFEARKDRPAITAMYDALIAQPAGTPWLIATGNLTNVALLFAVYSDLVDHIAGLSIMGGAIGGGFTDAPLGSRNGEGERFGNWTPWAEYNIYIDPESAAAVLQHEKLSAKTTLIALDLTHQFLATADVLKLILHGGDASKASERASTDTTRKLFHEIVTFFAATYAEVFGLTSGPPLHDPLAVAAAILPDLFEDDNGARYAVSVVTEGEHGASDQIRSGSSQCGRTVAKLLPPGTPGVRIPKGLQVAELWHLIDMCLARAESVAQSVM